MCEGSGTEEALCWQESRILRLPCLTDARPMSPSPPPTPAASPSQMKTKLESMLAYPFDCTLTFEAYEQVGTTAAAPPACWP